MRNTETRIRQFISDESGVTAIEYGLLAALIALIIIAGAWMLGTNLNTLFKDIAGCISSPTTCKFR